MTALTNQLISLYEPITRACCRSLRLPEDQVEDVISDTFLAAYRSLPKYRNKTKMSTWLWTIAQRQAINLLRKRIAQPQHLPPDLHASLTPPHDPITIAESREQREKLHLSIARLPADWAKTVRLFYWQHRSTHEIAMQLQIAPGTIRVILHRSRLRLRQELERMYAA